MKNRSLTAIIFFLILACGFPGRGYSQGYETPKRTLIYFYSPACKKCHELKSRLLPQIREDFKDRLDIQMRDITRMDDYTLLLRLEEKYHPKLDNSVPLFFFEDRFLTPEGIQVELTSLLATPKAAAPEEKAGRERIFYRFFALTPATVAGAGLIDGINPCAFTVIIFFMSFLAMQGYRRRELLAIGLAFILAVFATYILIGMGLFSFLYRLKGFWFASKIINISVGAFSILLGTLALYDSFRFSRTREATGMLLQLPPYLKNRIHSVIGSHYRQVPGQEARRNLFGLVMSALATGFIVSLIEAVCTGQVYLPTIVFVLKTTHLKLQALGYLFMYNLLFIIPLVAIFFFSLMGVTSQQFSGFIRRHLALIKALMAVLFFVLGASLVYSYIPARIIKLPIALESRNTPAVTSCERKTDSEVWDFGKVKEGSVLKHAFIFNNKSRNTINIKSVHTSCGCTVSKVEKTRLGPGEGTALKVRFDTKGYAGPVRQYVYVNTDNPDEPVARFIVAADVERRY
ncbi:MAG: DUF1573 domain-containing protein [Candidatus Omnitrophota bacterium]